MRSNNMSKLSTFFIALSQNPALARQFNAGQNDAEREANRMQLLQQAGVTEQQSQHIARLSQADLRELLCKELSASDEQWFGCESSYASTNDTDNKLGLIGQRQVVTPHHAQL
ncbi:hypothetical protein EV696_110117 [Permianibacter aggregans]|uniref:Uncharacterized protein n=2 Tax=Permianibacter aggregans TaxID=1510150 RepID=A0A4R6UQJ2_9GAMM|nr:hypothetical protein EV696_110117 [Permianibacter aggregans]